MKFVHTGIKCFSSCVATTCQYNIKHLLRQKYLLWIQFRKKSIKTDMKKDGVDLTVQEDPKHHKYPHLHGATSSNEEPSAPSC